MTKPVCSLSLDLDNAWSYLKTHGDAGWESYPSYLDVVVPRFLDVLARRGLSITVFVVGQDAALDKNREALASIAAAGHEIGNHSYRHEPWIHRYTAAEVDDELACAEDAIESATGRRTRGFRGPGYSLSETMLRVLIARGYRYDASTFPSFLGPIARAYYFMTTRLDPEEKAKRKELFGSAREGLRPLDAYRWRVDGRELLEIPVTTLPILRVPIHVSYVLYLSALSPALARSYFESAMAVCRATGTAPSILLHPLDFLGAEDRSDLAFFPAMGVPSAKKVELVENVLDGLGRWFTIASMEQHAAALEKRDLPRKDPIFYTAEAAA